MVTILIALALAAAAPQAPIVWGGDHVELEVAQGGTRIEFDCAHGTLDEAPAPDEKGAFSVKGTFTPERSGPSRGEPPAVAARYSGTIAGDRMTLRVVVEGQDPEGRTYALVRGQRGNLRKCR